MHYKYKDPDEYIIFNEDPDLECIKVDLPIPPKPEEIINYGLPPDEQKFFRPQIPPRLLKLNKDNSISLDEKAALLKEDPLNYEEEIAFIQSEWDKRLNGVWYYIKGKPTYMPGGLYFYLCNWYLENKYPEYRDRDRKFFIFSEFCEHDENCYGFVYPKHRREGATTKVACWNYEYISRVRRSRGGIQSMTEGHAQIVFQEHLVKGFRRMPFWFKPMFEGSSNPKEKLSFNSPALRMTRTNMGTGDTEDLESSIDYGSSSEGVYDGSRLERYHADEVGKTKEVDIYQRHLIVKKTLEELNTIIGKSIYTSTAGEMTKGGGEQFKELIEASNYNKRDGNGRTSSGLYVLFMPATEGFIYDEYGESIIDDPSEVIYDYKGKQIKVGSLNYLLNDRKQALIDEDFKKLNESTRQMPIRLRDCFRSASETDNFNMKIINDQLDKYQFGNNDVTVGDFVWKDGIEDGRVVFEPKETGNFKVSYLFENPKDSNRSLNIDGIIVPANTKKFIAGGDTFKFNKTRGSKHSKGGGAVFMKRDYAIDKDTDAMEEWKTHRFVCTYLHKPKSREVYCEDMLMMSIYYGCRMCPEINVSAIWDHFEKRGYGGYLHYMLDKKTGKYKTTPGINTQTGDIEAIFRLYQSFIEYHGYRCVHDDLLTQLLEIKSDMGDYDLFAAGGMALSANDNDIEFNHPEDDKLYGDNIDDYYESRYL